nr:MAG TPA: hypothetical protein [Caudoviricetes sp.]DAG98399.1 MAG TPA: hypothetical protein [Herelleviridae sp.]
MRVIDIFEIPISLKNCFNQQPFTIASSGKCNDLKIITHQNLCYL